MSTRAIIGVQTDENQAFKGAWQWNNGGTPLPILSKYFNSVDKINKLIDIGHYGCLMSARDAEEFKEWLVGRGEPLYLIEKRFVDVLGNGKAFAYISYEGQDRPAETFENLSDALGQDVSYVYIFNPETKKWKRHYS